MLDLSLGLFIGGSGLKGGSGFTPVTLTGLTCKLSTANGLAFITTPSVDLTDYIDRKITLSDEEQTLVGWVKIAGAGETLDSELITPSWTNYATGKWDTLTQSGTDITNASDTAGAAIAHIGTSALPAGALYKYTATITSATGSTNFRVRGSGVVGASSLRFLDPLSNGSHAVYKTIDLNATYDQIMYIKASGAAAFAASGNSLKKVLTASATGVRIVSEKGGATYNWTSNSGINANAASFTATITAE